MAAKFKLTGLESLGGGKFDRTNNTKKGKLNSFQLPPSSQIFDFRSFFSSKPSVATLFLASAAVFHHL